MPDRRRAAHMQEWFSFVYRGNIWTELIGNRTDAQVAQYLRAMGGCPPFHAPIVEIP